MANIKKQAKLSVKSYIKKCKNEKNKDFFGYKISIIGIYILYEIIFRSIIQLIQDMLIYFVL